MPRYRTLISNRIQPSSVLLLGDICPCLTPHISVAFSYYHWFIMRPFPICAPRRMVIRRTYPSQSPPYNAFALLLRPWFGCVTQFNSPDWRWVYLRGVRTPVSTIYTRLHIWFESALIITELDLLRNRQRIYQNCYIYKGSCAIQRLVG